MIVFLGFIFYNVFGKSSLFNPYERRKNILEQIRLGRSLRSGRIHEVRVGICGCASSYDHRLEGKRVVLAGRVCEIKEVPISEAIGWSGFDKQRKELKASRCHFLLENHGERTELFLCQMYGGKRYYIGDRISDLPWLAKRERCWEGTPHVNELIKGMQNLSLEVRRSHQWLAQ